MIVVMYGLPCIFGCIFSLTIFRATSLFVMSAMAALMMRRIANPLGRLGTSTLHSALLALVHLLLELGSVEPSPQDLEVVPVYPSSDKSFISRSTIV